ncbi:unnamed protein product [Ambrosiozyma monospora]|uniref:Unnamed protein product n=1 Tax=Ambrosiozyma monospora TaxID=43982 RepID=A0ACB5T565_AMBMO|nr:unnamed protein product [Ambrosiozyma monospora]
MALYHYNQQKKQLEEGKATWASWISSSKSSADQQLEDAKKDLDLKQRDLQRYGSNALKDAQSKYNQFVESQKKLSQDAYNNARFQLEAAQKKIDEGKQSVATWTSSKNQDSQLKLEQAKDAVEKSKNDLNQWGKDAFEQAEKNYNSFVSTLQDTANDHYKTALNNWKSAKENAKKYGNNVNAKAQEAVDQAQSQLEEARSQFENFGADAIKAADDQYAAVASSIGESIEFIKGTAQQGVDNIASSVNAANEKAKAWGRDVKDDAGQKLKDAGNYIQNK